MIRANRNRKAAAPSIVVANIASSTETDTSSVQPMISAEDGQLGDEYISLTFNESSDEESDEDDEDDTDTDDTSDDKEGQSPTETTSIDIKT